MPEPPMPKAQIFLDTLARDTRVISPIEGELVRTLLFLLSQANKGEKPDHNSLLYAWNKVSKSECWWARYKGIVQEIQDYSDTGDWRVY